MMCILSKSSNVWSRYSTRPDYILPKNERPKTRDARGRSKQEIRVIVRSIRLEKS